MPESQRPPADTLAERDLDSRLGAATSNASLLIADALKQLAIPPSIPEEETFDFEILTPVDLAMTRSATLLEEARDHLASPTHAPLELTESEAAENKAAKAWLQTYRQIEQTNDVRSDASQDLARSILKDIEEEDESIALLDPPKRPSTMVRSTSKFVENSSSFREEKRAKRLSRSCGGPRVVAVVAKIEAIDETTAPCQPQNISGRVVLANCEFDSRK